MREPNFLKPDSFSIRIFETDLCTHFVIISIYAMDFRIKIICSAGDTPLDVRVTNKKSKEKRTNWIQLQNNSNNSTATFKFTIYYWT